MDVNIIKKIKQHIEELKDAIRTNDVKSIMRIYNEIEEEVDWNSLPDYLFEEYSGIIEDAEIMT